jgi:hypothetical protein
MTLDIKTPLPVSTRKPIVGISARAASIGKMIDRLRPGRYIIEVTKSDVLAEDWKVEIIRADVVQKISLSNYVPE